MRSRSSHDFLDQALFGMPWEPQFWDTERWRPQAVARRGRAWIAATRRRRWTAWIIIALFVLIVFPGLISAISTAQSGTATPVAPPNSALSWMDIKDSSGVEVSSYQFATNRGGVLSPGNLVMSFLISVLFAVWLVAVTTGVWLPGSTLDFGWLNMFGAPLRGVAENFTAQIATPMVLMTFVAIGAVCVGVFIARGHYSKGAMQVVTMVGMAILGPLFLAEPLGEVLSSHGLLVQGRDLGISVAAGLNGDSNPDPRRLAATMQAQMADNFVRRPLQVWNFGHVVDDRPSCKAAWSSGVMAGDEERIKNGLKACGDSAAYAAADNPSVGQIGAGLLLLLCAVILLLFAAYLAIKIIWAALDTIYYGFMTIFGFAAGGFVYGPTQTFTVRCVVHGFIAAGRMAIFVIFLGLYQLFMGSLFQQARGQVMAVFVIGAIVEIVAIVQLRRLSSSIDSGNDWIANRFAFAIQNGGSSQSAGSGGTALGMGNANASNSMSPVGMLAAATAINSSPVTAWLAGGRLNPLMPWSFVDQVDKRNKARGLATRDLRMAAHGNLYDRVAAAEFARAGAHNSQSRRTSQRAAAFAAENVAHVTGMMGSVPYALRMAGFNWNHGHRATIARADIEKHADAEPLASKHLGRVLAAHKLFERDYQNGEWAAPRLFGLEASVGRYRGDYPGGVRLHDDLAALGRDYVDNPNKQWIETLQAHVDGPITDPAAARIQLHGQQLTQVQADRLRSWIANEHALRVQAATRWVAEDPTDFQRIRTLRSEIDKAAQTDQWQAGRKTTGAVSLPQPDHTAQPIQAIPNRLLQQFRNPG
ncbi:hypothetical protein [Nocardia asiatica]|uniref:hypothetical protein n=1 Tax=Nocardia asiatica TaxID=209252 RepID=UPI003EE25921